MKNIEREYLLDSCEIPSYIPHTIDEKPTKKFPLSFIFSRFNVKEKIIFFYIFTSHAISIARVVCESINFYF